MQSSTGRCTIFPVKISVDDGPYITLTMKATPMNFLLSNHPVTWSLDDVMCWYLLYCSESNTLVTKEASGQIDFSQDSQRHCQLLIAIHSSNWVATQSTLGDLVSSFHCCISNCMQSLLSVFLVIAQVCIYNLLSWVTSIVRSRWTLNDTEEFECLKGESWQFVTQTRSQFIKEVRLNVTRMQYVRHSSRLCIHFADTH